MRRGIILTQTFIVPRVTTTYKTPRCEIISVFYYPYTINTAKIISEKLDSAFALGYCFGMLCEQSNTQFTLVVLEAWLEAGQRLEKRGPQPEGTVVLEDGQNTFICKMCLQIKPLSERAAGRNACQACRREYHRSNKESAREYSRDDYNARMRAYRQNPEVREHINAAKRKASKDALERAKVNPEELAKLRQKRWNAQLRWLDRLRDSDPIKYASMMDRNRAKDAALKKIQWATSIEYRERQSGWHKNRRKTCPEFRMAQYIRNRINAALLGRRKSTKAFELVGCTVAELRVHLEAQFKEGMSWSNWGMKESDWQIDHHRPLASFNLADPTQQKAAFGFKNLKPLWASENLSKSSSWNGRKWKHTDHPLLPDAPS